MTVFVLIFPIPVFLFANRFYTGKKAGDPPFQIFLLPAGNFPSGFYYKEDESMSESMMKEPISRRTFLKLAAGSAAGALLFHFPFQASAAEETAKSLEIRPCALSALPAAEESAKNSPLVKGSYEDILRLVNTIHDSGLRSWVLSMIQHPEPTFMENYGSSSKINQVYNRLVEMKLADPAKISAETLFPPVPSRLQPFMTAPGSGYMSHHPYPGGLATHVCSNLHITAGICRTYKDVFGYDVDYDIAMAGQALHDIEKPFVFQWQKDGSSRKEYTLAGQGAHHVLSIAESMYRGIPAEVVVAQACAHGAPSSPKEEADVVGWIKAAALLAGKDPVRSGYLRKDGEGLPAPHKQEGYIVHLGDHDWVLTSPASQKSIAILKNLSASLYGIDAEKNPDTFNRFRNYIGSQVSFMYINHLSSFPDGEKQIESLAEKIVTRN